MRDQCEAPGGDDVPVLQEEERQDECEQPSDDHLEGERCPAQHPQGESGGAGPDPVAQHAEVAVELARGDVEGALDEPLLKLSSRHLELGPDLTDVTDDLRECR
ncbi:MAG: hypothetical protein QOH66_1959 [Actinomycetota bacterium]|nr:hypothetical protein [Actinomycetota bacterium]